MKMNPRIALFGLACLTLNMAYSFHVQAATSSKSAVVVEPAAKVTEFITAYGRKANIEILARTLVIPKLEDVVKEMENHQVKIFKVVDSSSKEKKHFAFLSEVPAELKEKLEAEIAEVKEESAIFIAGKTKGLQHNILLVAEISPPTNLFHEFAHHLFEVQNADATTVRDQQIKEFESFLRVYNRRIGSALLDDYSYQYKHWREQFDGYVDDYSKYLDGIQGQFKSEEVAIETGLVKLMLQVKSPYFSEARAFEGVKTYCQAVVIDGTDSMIAGTIAFMDKLRKTGQLVGEDWTPEEGLRREEVHAKINIRFTLHRNRTLRFMQIQTNEAYELLQSLKK